MTNVQSVQQGNNTTYTTRTQKQTNENTMQDNDNIFLPDDNSYQEPVKGLDDDTDVLISKHEYGVTSKFQESDEDESNLIDKFLSATNPVYVTCDAISENRGVSETIVDIFKSAAGSLNPVYGVYRFLTSD